MGDSERFLSSSLTKGMNEMLVSFSVSNFKSFSGTETIEMSPGRSRSMSDHIRNDCLTTAAIFGANASGKSTLVEGIEMMKRITLGPLVYGSEPLYNWDSKNPYTEFSIVFTVGQIQYHYTIQVESICNGEKSPFKRVCTYHIRHESLYFSDLDYEPKHDGSIVEELIFERHCPRPVNLVETQSLIVRRRRLYSRLKSLHIRRALAVTELSDSNSNAYDRIQKQIERTGRTLSRTMWDLEDRLNGMRGLSLVRIYERDDVYYDRSEIQTSRRFAGTIIQHNSKVRNWFEKSLIILGTKDLYIPGDDMENLTRVINSMGIGIDSLVWDRYNRKYDAVYELDLKDWFEVSSHWEDSSNYEGPIIAKTKNGIFRFTRDDHKGEIWMLSPIHNNNKRPLYSESDGTVRLIELASILIPTTDDLTFIVDAPMI